MATRWMIQLNIDSQHVPFLAGLRAVLALKQLRNDRKSAVRTPQVRSLRLDYRSNYNKS